MRPPVFRFNGSLRAKEPRKRSVPFAVKMRPLHGAAEGRRTEFFRLLVFRPISPKRIGEHLTVRSPQPKPRRGVLFIGARKRLLILLFVFRQRDQGLIQIGMFAPCSRRGKTKRKG